MSFLRVVKKGEGESLSIRDAVAFQEVDALPEVIGLNGKPFARDVAQHPPRPELRMSRKIVNWKKSLISPVVVVAVIGEPIRLRLCLYSSCRHLASKMAAEAGVVSRASPSPVHTQLSQ